MAGVSKHTLRFWEKTLSGVIVPLRTKGRQRRYTKHHLKIVSQIKQFKKDGLSLNEIRERMAEKDSLEKENGKENRIDLLANQIAEVVKASIYDFLSNDD